MTQYKLKFCEVCGKELRRYGVGQQIKYCGPVCAAIAVNKRRTVWAKTLTTEQARHWYRA